MHKVAFLRLKSDDVFRNNDVMTAGYAVLINVMDDGDLKRNLKKTANECPEHCYNTQPAELPKV